MHRVVVTCLLLLVAVSSCGAYGEARGAAMHQVGFGFGGGVRVSSHDLVRVGGEWALPSFEIGFFDSGERSVDISIPVLRMVASPILVERLWIGSDAFVVFRRPIGDLPDGGTAWAAAGPGAGFMVSTGAGTGTAGPRLAGRIGVELRNPVGGSSVSFLLVPGVLFEFGDIGVAVSGGAQLWMKLAWIRPKR